MGQGGVEIPINRNQLHIKTIKPYLLELQMTKNLDKLVVYSIKLVRMEPLDIEEEGSNFKGLSIRAARSIKARPTQALIGKGPILD